MAQFRCSPTFLLNLKRFWKRFGKYIIFTAVAIPLAIIIKNNWPRRLHRKYVDVDAWLHEPTIACEGNFGAYGKEFAQLRYARFDKQTKQFGVPCKGKLPKYYFYDGSNNEGTPLDAWLKHLKRLSYDNILNDRIEKTPTVVVLRHEAHNLYHTLCEWYNVFLLSKLLKFDPNTAGILFMDDRPPSPVDPTWDKLFGKVMRYSEVPDDVIFEKLVWNVIGYESPANFHWQYVLPYADEFYRFFIKAYHMPIKSKDCSKVIVRVVVRRDYNSHPERAKIAGGLVQRKFANEDELLKLIKFYLPSSADVKLVVLETMKMQEQIEMFTNTDILIGMHGAGMSHTMFLPPHAVVFEMFPRYWGQLKHFRAFARWRGLKYFVWKNINYRNEHASYSTYIPPLILKLFIPKVFENLCPPDS